MTFGKLRELLETMSDNQLKQQVLVVHDRNGLTGEVCRIVDVRVLKDEETGKIYPALIP